MSSIAVRTTIKDFIALNAPTENVVDLTAQYETLQDTLDENNIPADQTWLGLEFIGGEEAVAALAASNTSGLFREEGVVQVYVMGVAGLSTSNQVLQRAETLRALFRQQRFGGITIDGLTTANFDTQSSIDLQQGYYGATFFISYSYEFSI